MEAQACPHCGSHNHRILADLRGSVVWCQDCHRTWEAAKARTAVSAAVAPDGMNKPDLRAC